ncbi:gag-pol polyprotein [Tanacetum coccineum]
MAESAKRHDENSNLIKEIRASTDASIRNQGASIKALKIQIGQMSKVLQERGSGSLPEHDAFFQAKSIDYSFPSRLIDDSYKEKEVLDEFIDRRESTTNLNRLLREKPRIGYQIEASINVHDSTILEDSLLLKEKDPVGFTIPCHINNISFEKALADLGASVSVMPYSTFTNLGLGELAPTKLIIELADRTIKCPKGIAENVLVVIDKFVFPVYFIILDIPKDIKVPLILRRPFLSTTHDKIDVFKKRIALRIGNDKIVFKSDNPTSNIIKRVYVLGLREQMKLDLEARLMGEALILNRSLDLEGKVVDEPMVNIIRTRNDDEKIEGIHEYPIVENMDTYRDQDMGEVIVRKPFCRVSCVEARWFDGLITIHNGNNNVTYQMAHSHPRFKHLINKQCNMIRPLLKALMMIKEYEGSDGTAKPLITCDKTNANTMLSVESVIKPERPVTLFIGDENRSGQGTPLALHLTTCFHLFGHRLSMAWKSNIHPQNSLISIEDWREETSPPGFSTLTPLSSPNVGELPPITVSTFIAKTPENTPLANHASTSAIPGPLISLAFVEANYEVLESLLRKHGKQTRNKDLHIELDYYSEEYDKEREMEPRHALVRETTLVERESEGRRPSEQRVEDRRSRRINLPLLLASHLRRNDNGQPLYLQPFNGHIPTYVNSYFLPNAGMTYDQPSSYSFHAQGGNVFFEGAFACHPYGGYASQAPMSNYGLFSDSTGCVTLFVCWIKDYPLPDELKIPSHMGSYDGKGDPDNYLHLFEGSSWDNSRGKKKNRDRFSLYKGSNHGLLSNLSKSPREILATEKAAKTFEQPPGMVRSRRSRDMSKYCHFHEDHGHDTNQCWERRRQIKETAKSGKLAHLVKGIKKGKTKALGTQLGEWKKGDKDIVPVKAHILMISRESPTSKRKSAEDLVNGTEEITFPLFLAMITPPILRPSKHLGWILKSHSLVSQESNLGLSMRTAMKKMSIVVSRVHTAIKFHTPYRIGTMTSTYESNEVEEGQKRYAEKTIIIRKQLPTSFKKRLQDLLQSNTDVFTWTYADITGISRTITIGGKPVNTEHKLNEYNHIKPVKPKKCGLCLDHKEATCKEVDELTNVGTLRKVKDQTWVANLVMVKKSNRG